MPENVRAKGITIVLLCLLVNVREARPETGGQDAHLAVQSIVRDIVRHPLFAGFGRLILPWDDRPYDEDMPLARIGSLLPSFLKGCQGFNFQYFIQRKGKDEY